ncbi:thiamine-monophosphate kinase [Brachybacterium sp. GCM10030267]|uniref:thiamine-phosphate kinase n=1 Tax=unclassified Brachybacterium TaxID=2623841 RepID=UPI003622F3E5
MSGDNGDDTTLGEAGLLARMLPHLSADPRAEVGPGDDAAVVRLPSPRLVVTTDTLVEGHDFLSRTTTPRWIGHKAAVQNLADIAAMGAQPVSVVVAISAPGDTPARVFEQITMGLAQRAEADGVSVVGGDLGRADRLTVTVTALGALEENEPPVLRSGARPGDEIAVGSPRLGRSAAGLALVLSGRIRVEDEDEDEGEEGDGRAKATIHGGGEDAGETPGGSATDRPTAGWRLDDASRDLVRWHDAPDPDLSLGWTVGRRASAMMDLSDGLVQDGTRIALASGVVLDLDPEALAPDVALLEDLARDLDTDPWQWVLHGGEEHAMLATFPAGSVPDGFRPIGTVRAAEGDVSAQAGSAGGGAGAGGADRVLLAGAAITGTGFDHFDGHT